ncbi:hypothetical protein V6N13_091227 [Hibiscus sabdariffa]
MMFLDFDVVQPDRDTWCAKSLIKTRFVLYVQCEDWNTVSSGSLIFLVIVVLFECCCQCDNGLSALF